MTLRLPAALIVGLAASPACADATNVVLVHGMTLDGSGWRAVSDLLEAEGLDVTVAQLPLTGLADDVAAARRAIEAQDGPTVLVGHSYGGAVISAAGTDAGVAALVYVAALQPDAGETVQELNASFPSLTDPAAITFREDGFFMVDPGRFAEFIAADLPPAEADFLARSQTWTSSSLFTDVVAEAAWRDKPSHAVVATQDLSVHPDLQRWMYERAGATVTEVEASHMVQVSQPEAVAAVIAEAARAAD